MNKLYVAFIWHMHQPYYKDVSKNVSIFPWVRLHAIKNYYNMVSILKAFPRIKQTFNLVPSLLLQIKEYIKGEATDLWLEKTLKRVKDLTIEDKKFILENFFLLNKEKMGFVFPRYKELYDKKIRGEDYNEQDFLDLQVLYNLAWFDPELRTLDSFLNYLRIKGQNFTEEEKIKLIEKQFEVMKELFGLYKSFQESGQIEIIFSPFFHPIMPLLINTESAKFSTPELPLPFVYFSFVEDAKRQLKLGKEFYKELFDKEPYGMWPSEQAVSPELVELISEFNIKWIVTDEKVLFKTLGKEVTRDKNGFVLEPEILYKPYKLTIKDKEVFILFRDQFLSDRIGFVYMNYPPMEGAKDFYHRLLKIKESLPTDKDYLVTIALDGENCWEYYDNDGREFLKYLYSLISESKDIETTTVRDFLEKQSNFGVLDTIFTGSWINADLTTWIGEIEENLGWEYLSVTRRYLEREIRKNKELNQKIDWKSLFAAEGSDWFWWYGEDQESGYDEIFDYIFRKHLKNVYKSIKEDYPSFIDFPIVFKKPIWENRPSLVFTPIIDGKISNEKEWELSSLNLLGEEGIYITKIYYGYDLNNFYLRIDTQENFKSYIDRGFSLEINFYSLNKKKLSFRISKRSPLWDGVKLAIEDILELAIPLQLIIGEKHQNSKVYFEINLYNNNNTLLESFGKIKPFCFKRPDLIDEIITKLYLSEKKDQKVYLESWIIFRNFSYNLYTKIIVLDETLYKDYLEIEKHKNLVKVKKNISLRELLFLLQLVKDMSSFSLINWDIYSPVSEVEKRDKVYLLKPTKRFYNFLKYYLEKETKNILIAYEKLGLIEIYGL